MTDQYVILGDPVDHSRSPTIQNAAFRHTGLDAEYWRRTTDEASLDRAIQELRSGRVKGANVTMPHKFAAARLVDEVRGFGARMGAVNTLWTEDGRVIGDSTDPIGVRHGWEVAGLPTTAPVLVLGSGGAAAAALVALDGRALRLSARRTESARDLVVSLESDASVIPWGEAIDGAVVVNATPLGMRGERLPPSVVASAAGLFEMTYGPIPSPAQRELGDRHLPVATGLMMLIGQAVASFKLWTGIDVPHSVMYDALAAAESG